MNADLIVQPIDEIRAAVDTLTAGLSRREVISPEQWDRSVATLARCHDQVGGDTRSLVYATFEASAHPGCAGSILEKLRPLNETLGLQSS